MKRRTSRAPKPVTSNPRVSAAGVEWKKKAPVFHATTALEAVLRDGLKSRAQIREETGREIEAAGGRHDTSISFALDPRVAEAIAYTIWQMGRIARGELSMTEFRDRLKREQPDLYDSHKQTHLKTDKIFENAENIDRGWVRHLNMDGRPWAPGDEGESAAADYTLDAYKAIAGIGASFRMVHWPMIYAGEHFLASLRPDDIGVVQATLDLDWVIVERRDMPSTGVVDSFDAARSFADDWYLDTSDRLWDESRGIKAKGQAMEPINTAWRTIPPGVELVPGVKPSIMSVGEYNAGESEVRVWNRRLVKNLRLYKTVDQIAQSLHWFSDEPPLFYPAFDTNMKQVYLGDEPGVYVRNGAVDIDARDTLASIFAGWQAGEGDPMQSFDPMERIAPVFGLTEDELFDSSEKVDSLRDASDAQRENALLPPVPPNATRLVHSILRRAEGMKSEADVLSSIIAKGLVASPEGAGKYSEAPELVFFVAFDPRDPGARYNKYTSWVVFDVPHDWEGWGGAVGASFMYDRGLYDPPRPGGVVGIWKAVPAEFLVGVNGVPVDMYLKGYEFWEQNFKKGGERG